MRRFATLAFLLYSLQAGATPGILSYEAKVTDSNGQPINSIVDVTFTFWDAASGGNQLGGGFSDTDSVLPVNGVFSTDVGDDPGNLIPASIFASNGVWLNANVDGTDVTPRRRVTPVAFALNALPSSGPAYVVAEVTASASTNGSNLIAAYNRAKALTPHGQPLSADNRAVVLVAPGNYDLGTNQLVMDTEFVDIAGISSARDDQYIYGLGTANGVTTGVLRQTANNVRLENLRVHCTQTSGPPYVYFPHGLAAYFPESDLPATVIRNCKFESNNQHAWAMRVGINYSGTYEDCDGGDHIFGGSSGTASGRFTGCKGGNEAFGGYLGAATGTFIDCTGGRSAFGGDQGLASGTFTNCTSTDVDGFGGGGVASGTFTNCKGTTHSFGGEGGTASGTFTNCTGGNYSFGGAGTASGTFTNCNGGDYSFGGADGVANGMFINCTGLTDSFGSGGSTSGAKLYHCRLIGPWGGAFSGRMENCIWGSNGTNCDANARIYGSTFQGYLSLNNTAAGATMTRAQSISDDANNVFGTTASLNLKDPDVN
ncbi:MAG: hypothetical protein K1X53_03400 [Candidatus Sumerlaeaceae bacterium]|nr:hypothetical protein [Candidatus Sumerlaeaceae bacterium]